MTTHTHFGVSSGRMLLPFTEKGVDDGDRDVGR